MNSLRGFAGAAMLLFAPISAFPAHALTLKQALSISISEWKLASKEDRSEAIRLGLSSMYQLYFINNKPDKAACVLNLVQGSDNVKGKLTLYDKILNAIHSESQSNKIFTVVYTIVEQECMSKSGER